MFTSEGAEPLAGLLHQCPLSSQAPRGAILVILRHSPEDSQSSISTIHDPVSGICFQPSIRRREADAESATLGFVLFFHGLLIQFNSAVVFFIREALVVGKNVLH